LTPINLLDLLEILRRDGRRIALWCLGLGIAGYLLSFAFPAIYRSTAVIMPPDEDELTSSLSMARRNLSSLGRLGGPYFTQADIALAILRSHGVAENVARSLKLQDVYDTKDLESAVDRLRERIKVRISNDGTISVTAEDHTAARSAEIANRYLAELDVHNQRFRSARARRTREFLEHRVTSADSSLRESENLLVRYQSRRGEVVLSPDSRAAGDAGASFLAQKLAAESELQLLREIASPNSEEVARLESRVRQYRRQLGELPATQMGAAELLRSIGIQQQVMALLMTQLEEARLREAMDTPTIQVLDAARPPSRRAWPRRSWIAAFGMAVGLVIGLADPLRRFHGVRPTS
jgi:uncharacterized protein involved in exopolysaccharide biosynthesis